jgi:hypothetical protein
MSTAGKNRAQLAQELYELQLDGSEEEVARKITAVISHLPAAEAMAVMELVTAMRVEAVAAVEADLEQFRLAGSVFDGLEDRRGLTLKQAAEIKAAQGDAVAIALLKKWNSREHRLGLALLKAATEAHPDWVVESRGYRFVGQGEPQESNALIEWFQTTHPKQAKAVEAAIGPDADDESKQ